MRFLDLVDSFIAPSQFLADRYAAWGLPEAKLVVLENSMPHAGAAPASPIPAGGILRIGFFGQISLLKGIDVLFDAAAELARESNANVSFEIHGDYRGQPEELRATFLERLAGSGRNVHFHGPYDRERVDRLMRSVHAVLVPSIWWENSPIVIQEALRNRRPVICSDIGGMAEKVRDGIDGFHFPAGDAMALAGLLRDLVENRRKLTDLAAGMNGKAAKAASVEDYLELYRRAAAV
jgi:glycosyltransferase involved in cell wall biosynthesis